MVKYVCSRCGYRFESEIKKKERLCPYCGEVSAKEEQGVQELLKNS